MSRATRPLRRVRGADRDGFLTAALAWLALDLGRGGGAAWWCRGRLRAAARALGMCRPAQLRRCLLGLPVSARAAAKILAAANGPNIRREPGR